VLGNSSVKELLYALSCVRSVSYWDYGDHNRKNINFSTKQHTSEVHRSVEGGVGNPRENIPGRVGFFISGNIRITSPATPAGSTTRSVCQYWGLGRRKSPLLLPLDCQFRSFWFQNEDRCGILSALPDSVRRGEPVSCLSSSTPES
jgi:hypothetical protein